MSALRYSKPAVLPGLPRRGAVVIEASAGTGKTYTLEHLIVDLLLRDEPVPIEQILVVTFTERATGEMRQRVRETIARLLAAGPAAAAAPEEPAWVLDAGARARLERALQDFDQATIATIHGFCQRVLVEYAFANHRLLRQELCDGREVFGRAFRLELRQRFAVEPALRPYFRAGLAACGGRVEGLADHLYRCARIPGALAPAYDPARLEAALAGFPLEDALDDGLEPRLKAVIGGRSSKAAAKRVVDVARLVAAGRAHGDLPRLLGEHEALHAAYADNPPLPYLAAKLGAADVPPGPVARLRDGCAALRAACVPVLAAVTGRLLDPVRERVARLKREQGLFDFDDMLALVAESLRGPHGAELVATLRARYRHALIDEFQDTDPTQWDIFRRLFFGRDDGGQLFLIGDPKQAIYGFRGADVHTYVAARAAAAGTGAGEPAGVVALRPNFRSTADLIEALNRILDQGGTPPLFTSPAIQYDQPVTCGDRRLAALGAAGEAPAAPVVLLELGGRPVKAARTRALGEFIAAEIGRLVGPAAPLRFTRKLEGYAPRPLRPSDIFILTRTAQEGREIGAHLRAHGVPHAYYKEDGLFARAEARDVLDLLFAVAEPRDRARRLRAWLSPFFGVTLAGARRCREVPDAHPLMRRLLDWHELAAHQDWERLFGGILDESGLVRRELFGRAGERALTNYRHLCELLLEEARRIAPTPLELAYLLKGYVDGTRTPRADAGDVQRLESDAEAVQIMTMHKAKGLEAPVVFLAGGFTPPRRGAVRTYHEDGQRRAWLGTADVPDAVARLVDEEERQGNERLIYVAVTRAQARLYLPYFPPDFTPRGYAGSAFAPVNDRLRALAPTFDTAAGARRFERRPLAGGGPELDAAAAAAAPPAPFAPPPALLAPVPDPLPFAALRRERRGFVVTSYSAMKAAAGPGAPASPRVRAEEEGDAARAEEEGDAARADEGGAAAADALDDLPGGAGTGSFLHEVLEAVDLAGVAAAGSLDAWRAAPGVAALCHGGARRHGLTGRHVPRAQELVYAALAAPVTLAAPPATGPVIAGLATAAAAARELEFLYPLPEASRPLLAPPPAGPGADPGALAVARGFVQGFIDLLFVHDGRAYLVDWKSDLLPAYDAAALGDHVRRSYARQEQLYALAVCRLLGVRGPAEYDARFGGVLYCFLRGMARAPLGSAGVWFRRPSWSDVAAWEEDLRTLPPERLVPGGVAP